MSPENEDQAEAAKVEYDPRRIDKGARFSFTDGAGDTHELEADDEGWITPETAEAAAALDAAGASLKPATKTEERAEEKAAEAQAELEAANEAAAAALEAGNQPAPAGGEG